MHIAYADPPYPGNAHYYKDHPDYDGEVDHLELLERLHRDYDGFVLHTGSNNLYEVLRTGPKVWADDVRVMAWVKPFASFKPNVSPAYAWEPVLVKPARKPVTPSPTGIVMRDWVSESITLRKGLTGVKPAAVCRWAFEAVGARPDDTLDDLYPGTGAVADAWVEWCADTRLASAEGGGTPNER